MEQAVLYSRFCQKESEECAEEEVPVMLRFLIEECCVEADRHSLGLLSPHLETNGNLLSRSSDRGEIRQ